MSRRSRPPTYRGPHHRSTMSRVRRNPHVRFRCDSTDEVQPKFSNLTSPPASSAAPQPQKVMARRVGENKDGKPIYEFVGCETIRDTIPLFNELKRRKSVPSPDLKLAPWSFPK